MAGLGDRIANALGDDETTGESWGRRVEDLLYEGETVETTVEAGAGSRVVVTSHRVLTFTPGGPGANFSQVDRPNVVGVAAGARSSDGYLLRGVQWGLVGALLLVGGFVVDLGGMVADVGAVDDPAADRIGLGGLGSLLDAVLALVRSLDEMLLLGGALALVAGLAMAGFWYWDRDRTLVIEVAGDEDLHVPKPAEAGAAVDRLAAAVGTASDP